jgi:hypothetical protein
LARVSFSVGIIHRFDDAAFIYLYRPSNAVAPQIAYKKWKEYGNKNYPKKYCHFPEEPSN